VELPGAKVTHDGSSVVTQPAGFDATNGPPVHRVVGESVETVPPVGVAAAPAVGSKRARTTNSVSRPLPAKKGRDMTDDLLCGFRSFTRVGVPVPSH
jgi:hypothetical protein